MSILMNPAEVVIAGERRPLNHDKVKELKGSIQAVGQLQPVIVNAQKELIAGRHRLEACAQLEVAVRVEVQRFGSDDEELAQIDENFIRNNLTAQEESLALKRRKELLERKGLVMTSGRPKKGAESAPFSVADLAAGAGMSERTAQKRLQIADGITPESHAAIEGTPLADKPEQLLQLSRLSPEFQASVILAIKEGLASTVEEAMAGKLYPPKTVSGSEGKRRCDRCHTWAAETMEIGGREFCIGDRDCAMSELEERQALGFGESPPAPAPEPPPAPASDALQPLVFANEQELMAYVKQRKSQHRVGVLTSAESDEWSTDSYLYDALDAEFQFLLDPASTHENAKTPRHYTKAEDGRKQSWAVTREDGTPGAVFCNPPYSEMLSWVRLGFSVAFAGLATVVMLVKVTPETECWWDYTRRGRRRYLPERLKFGGSKTGAPFNSVVVIFDHDMRTRPRPVDQLESYWDYKGNAFDHRPLTPKDYELGDTYQEWDGDIFKAIETESPHKIWVPLRHAKRV